MGFILTPFFLSGTACEVRSLIFKRTNRMARMRMAVATNFVMFMIPMNMISIFKFIPMLMSNLNFLTVLLNSFLNTPFYILKDTIDETTDQVSNSKDNNENDEHLWCKNFILLNTEFQN